MSWVWVWVKWREECDGTGWGIPALASPAPHDPQDHRHPVQGGCGDVVVVWVGGWCGVGGWVWVGARVVPLVPQVREGKTTRARARA